MEYSSIGDLFRLKIAFLRWIVLSPPYDSSCSENANKHPNKETPNVSLSAIVPIYDPLLRNMSLPICLRPHAEPKGGGACRLQNTECKKIANNTELDVEKS